ncbi:MAG: ABC transporter ATP-binding protein [Cytophagales bacterium]|nr:ABC transporter ATP-binding protein [Cytophagales bacterium]
MSSNIDQRASLGSSFMLEISDLRKSYDNTQVLRGINLKIKKAEMWTVLGASGAGKTSLLHIIGSLDRPDAGKVVLNGTDISTLKGKSLDLFRNRAIGFVFQFHNLLPELSLLENVCLPGFISGQKNKEVEKRARELLSFLGVSNRMHDKPHRCSGGEAQRTAIARALINLPDLILADEPSGNLDSKNALIMHQLFRKIQQDLGQTSLIATHNKELASFSDKITRIQDGKLIEDNANP